MHLIAKSGGLAISTKPSRLGKGVYFAENEADALNVAKLRDSQSGSGQVVLKCRVFVGNLKDCGYTGHRSTVWNFDGFDSAKGMHPPWAGCPNHIPEYVLKDEKRHRINEIHLYKGSI